jgi:hypothetical protein
MIPDDFDDDPQDRRNTPAQHAAAETLRLAKRAKSGMLVANAWHAWSDAASSLVVGRPALPAH